MSKMISVASGFQYSVNIGYDLSSNEKLKNLVECVLIKVDVQNSEYQKTDEQMSGYMRDSDYMGMLPDGNLYVLLTNTTREGAVIVQDRFEKNGYKTEYVEMMSVCHRE